MRVVAAHHSRSRSCLGSQRGRACSRRQTNDRRGKRKPIDVRAISGGALLAGLGLKYPQIAGIFLIQPGTGCAGRPAYAKPAAHLSVTAILDGEEPLVIRPRLSFKPIG